MKIKFKLGVLLLSLSIVFGSVTNVYAQNTIENNYTYDFWGDSAKSIPAYELTRTINEEMLGIPVSGIDDVCTGGGYIFLVDTKESRVNVVDSDYKLVRSIKLIRNEENKVVTDSVTGNQLILTNPEGVWFHESGNEIYIADTGAGRIIVLDGSEYYLKRIIGQPDNMIGVTLFNPSKIVVDYSNKIYVVVQSGYEGIIELTENGKFSRYFGVNKPIVYWWDYFWKSISSDEQKSKMAKTYAPSFNNIDLDNEGFIFATTADSAAQEMVFRLNPKGENVLRQEGYFKVWGDMYISMFYVQSRFIDVAVNDYGVYAVLDQAKGRIFIYNFDGELINIFASSGDLKGDFKSPSSIAWYGDVLIATDKTLKCAYVYEMTEFGKAAMNAAKSYYEGEWEDSAAYSREALRLNANYDLAYIGIGKYYLMLDDYKTAMYYFDLGNDKKFYSKAYNGYRNIWVQKNFGFILAAILLAGGILVYSEVRYHRKGGQ